MSAAAPATLSTATPPPTASAPTGMAVAPPAEPSTPIGARLASMVDSSSEPDPWAPDPLLDGALAANLASALAAGGESEAAAALQESGFGSALHTALGELRRIADDPVLVPAGARAASSEIQKPRPGPDWPTAQPMSAAGRFGGTPAEWLGSLGDWWTTRWRDLLPGMVVTLLVVVAFAVVLATGAKRSNTSHVDTGRPIDSGPSTTIAGLFTTASVPPGDSPPPGDVPPSGSGSSDGHNPSPAIAPVTTKPSSSGAHTPSAPSKANPSSGSPAVTSPLTTQVSPPDTTPDTTPSTTPDTTPDTTPRQTTTVPNPPPTTRNICAIRPTAPGC